jgi:DNA-binding winged helix-turn-helix (wHTH) protein
MDATPREIRRFGPFELDVRAGELRRDGQRVKLQPQPFRLLALLCSRPGVLVTREEIRSTLWSEGTFVDFDQAVNFTVRQIRDALGDSAERPKYLETMPRQGYRFVAAITVEGAPQPPVGQQGRTTTVRLQKAVWANIAELRLAEARQRRMLRLAVSALVAVVAAFDLYIVLVAR